MPVLAAVAANSLIAKRNADRSQQSNAARNTHRSCACSLPQLSPHAGSDVRSWQKLGEPNGKPACLSQRLLRVCGQWGKQRCDEMKLCLRVFLSIFWPGAAGRGRRFGGIIIMRFRRGCISRGQGVNSGTTLQSEAFIWSPVIRFWPIRGL